MFLKQPELNASPFDFRNIKQVVACATSQRNNDVESISRNKRVLAWANISSPCVTAALISQKSSRFFVVVPCWSQNIAHEVNVRQVLLTEASLVLHNNTWHACIAYNIFTDAAHNQTFDWTHATSANNDQIGFLICSQLTDSFTNVAKRLAGQFILYLQQLASVMTSQISSVQVYNKASRSSHISDKLLRSVNA